MLSNFSFFPRQFVQFSPPPFSKKQGEVLSSFLALLWFDDPGLLWLYSLCLLWFDDPVLLARSLFADRIGASTTVTPILPYFGIGATTTVTSLLPYLWSYIWWSQYILLDRSLWIKFILCMDWSCSWYLLTISPILLIFALYKWT